MRKRKKKKLFKNVQLVNIIPSLATLAALFVGLTQVRFALGDQWEYAIVSVIAAAFLDATDGRLARFLNSCSRFGAELDSFSDFAVFGFCPAIVMYLFCLSRLGRPGWIISVFFAICMCLRLARFNTHDIENIKGPLSGKFFTGVPAPAGAIIALYPVILHNAFSLEVFRNEYFSAIFVAFSGLLCISRIPTLSIKKFHIKREMYTVFLLCIIILAGIVFAYTWKALSIMILLYLFSILFTARQAKMLLSKLNDQTAPDKKF
ncbi:MAG: CDP-alcohol phosphatidyltransferase family protein [Holosporales bacterium]|jgi:CDP-diacylglycerol--serine O-phosphatidyltransferase|nr:CDP-alcohol phosphatidyltransferase family protein [Holosporales bacterium]